MVRPVTPLVARAAELASLRDVVAAARSGHAGVALLGGDAGVGKTRLLTELLDSAVHESGDLQVLIGHCVDLGDTPPPYLPFTEAFARLAIDDPDTVGRLAAHVPHLRRLLPGSTAGGAADLIDRAERVDRGQLFEAVLRGLGALATDLPTLLVVEDTHWADQATRDLLGFLFTRIRTERLALVVTYRSDDLHRRHPLLPVLAQWARLSTVTRIELEPLGGDDTRTLIRTLHPAPLADAAVTDIVDRADGNAFFVEELLAAADQIADAGHLPWLLADLLLVRLNGLSDDAREVVRFAAVAGRQVPHGMLADAAAMPPPRLDAALREAVDAHVLSLTRGGRGYSFRHALVAEAVYDDLLPGERVRMHAAFARVLAEDDARSRAELARHALASHDLPTAYTASLAAGRDAMAVAAPQEALQHLETALELRAQLPDAPDDSVDLVVDLVDAAVAAGQASRGRRLASQGLAALPADASDIDRATVLYAVARAAIDSEAEFGSLDAAGEALELLPDEPSLLRVRVTSLYSRVCLYRDRFDEAEHWARVAVEDADALGRPGAATEAQTTMAMLARRIDEPAAVTASLLELTERARADGEVHAEIRSRYNLAGVYYEQGRLADAEAAYELAWRRAVELGRPWMLFGLDSRAMVSQVRYQRGDWDGALQAVDLGAEHPPGLASARLRSVALQVRAGRGEPDVVAVADSLRPWWDEESLVLLGSVTGALESHAATGSVDAASSLIDEAVRRLGAVWHDEWFLGRIRLSALALMAAARAVRDAPDRERVALVERVAHYVDDGRAAAERGAPIGRRPGVEASAWLQRLTAEWAFLRWLAGVDAPDETALVSAWRGACDAFDYGNAVELCRSRVRLATVLRAAGDATQARAVLEPARTAARRMGATVLLADIRALGDEPAAGRSSGSGSAQDPPSGLEALTDREREVLALLVEARTNRQIAARLYISDKTVSVHVSNILAKLGVRSRAEAAALARAGG